MKTPLKKEIMDNWERHWFVSFCNDEEIDRIFSPQNAWDYLLQQRANIVADNTRYLRVYMNKARRFPEWSFDKSFITAHYEEVLNHLSIEDKLFCENIAYGDFFSDDANGYAEKNKSWGRIIYLNESLQFFMKFCNLALFDFQDRVPDKVKLNALRIAIRIMMKQESMDFSLDPRGIVPNDIGIIVHNPIKYELQFIAGHEFCHHLCGHLNDNDVYEKSILSIGENRYYKNIYNTSQSHELEADIASIIRPQYNSQELCNIIEGALIWFLSLELSETAESVVNPASSHMVNTHPSAKDRFTNIITNIDIPDEFDMNRIIKLRSNTEKLKEWIVQDLSYNYDMYDFYGSVYLDAPNTKWRGKELVDRVDY
ncbi:MAG: hypothetical protein IJA52_02540 [Clostridia bacterium]|nr:hypothetical protein [Clostridia bacterium]